MLCGRERKVISSLAGGQVEGEGLWEGQRKWSLLSGQGDEVGGELELQAVCDLEWLLPSPSSPAPRPGKVPSTPLHSERPARIRKKY